MSAEALMELVNSALIHITEAPMELVSSALFPITEALMELVSSAFIPIMEAPMELVSSALFPITEALMELVSSALIPIMEAYGSSHGASASSILSCLWNTLVDLDDLTASTNSIMTLLAKLMAHPLSRSSPIITDSLTQLTPRLWPFLRHSIVSVRKAALETLLTLLTFSDELMKNEWLMPLYQDAVRHIYQRSVLENQSELFPLLEQVWRALLQCANMEHLYVLVVPWLGVWLAFLMQPPHMAFDPALLIEAKHKPRECPPVRARFQEAHAAASTEVKYYIGGSDASCTTSPEKDTRIYKARVCGARLLGLLADRLSHSDLVLPPGQEPPSVILGRLFNFHLQGKSAVQRFVVGQVLYFWASQTKPCPCPSEIVSQLLACLGELVYYDEIAVSFTRMQNDCQDFLASLRQEGVNLDTLYPSRQLLTLESALALTTTSYRSIRVNLKPQVLAKFDERVKQLHTSVQQTFQDQQMYSVRVLCSLAMAVVAMDALPEKLNPVVRPLMDVIKKEENKSLQEEASLCLAQLIKACIQREPSPNSKIIKNLCNFLCADPSITPQVERPMAPKQTPQGMDIVEPHVPCSPSKGILTLTNLQRVAEEPVRRRGRRPGSSIKLDGDSSVPGSNTEAELLQERAEQAQVEKFSSTKICFTLSGGN
ncbi:TATA-binding protein-associated factor 172-like [Plakobranchus ocellatus]|uniref:TATA-binding protein-associated factor 172-like n=1 Tax=Plakobranchus ocellatus TaxID=259542 RepID=A0AAV4BGS7_9GAST|nr:TATA-binding protein-associated factor 172-like [Plakobranchus ocellatus]